MNPSHGTRCAPRSSTARPGGTDIRRAGGQNARALITPDVRGSRPKRPTTLNASRRLVRLSEAGFALAQPGDDVRGRIVVGKLGYGIGTVADLLVDATSRRAVMMIVRGSDILLGEKDPLIPVDAIRRGDGHSLLIGQDHVSVAEAPGFEAERVSDRRYIAAVYRSYGLLPYWHPDYVYPWEWSQRLGDVMRGLKPRR